MLMDVWMEWAKKYGPLFHYRLYHKHVIPIVFGADPIKVDFRCDATFILV